MQKAFVLSMKSRSSHILCDFGLPTKDVQKIGTHFPLMPKIVPIGECYKPKTVSDYDLARKLSRDI